MSKRADAIGLFWQDVEKVRVVIEKIKRIAPQRTWESADYLPGLEQALAFAPQYYNDYELGQAALAKEPLIFDTEVYPNYVLFAFRGLHSKKVVCFELDNEPCGRAFKIGKLLYVLQNFCIINFNGRKYDFIIAALAVAGATTEDMWLATEMIITQGLRDKEVLRHFRVKKISNVDQIDLIELTALGPGLKVCAGRLHAQKLQDLPFLPGISLSDEQIAITFMYCFNDIDNTELLYWSLLELIKVREDTGRKYNLDLRSHSDQQMAETIIAGELKRMTGKRSISRITLPAGTHYKFQAAHFLKYNTALMQHVLQTIKQADFYVSEEDGNIVLPAEVVPVTIAHATYRMGIGGLHSSEKSAGYVANADYFIADTDATSYYPRLIVNAGLVPVNLGQDFLIVYKSILDTRVAAKRAGDTVVAECLKIVANGTFGKLGSKYSLMYAPDLMLQVTMTGQLSLLMLIETFELAGIQVLSANTDGIVTRCLRSQEAQFHAIVLQWEQATGFGTEEIRYKAIYSRDVNNYIAVYEQPQKGKLFKGKGVYAPTSSKKNAVTEICVTAATELMLNHTPLITTIKSCTQLSQFTCMRRVNGGAVKDGVYLGKIIRWYYSTSEQGEIIYAKSGNKVPRSEGGKPCMDLPQEFPQDIDYEWYVREANGILEDIGYSHKTVTAQI